MDSKKNKKKIIIGVVLLVIVSVTFIFAHSLLNRVFHPNRFFVVGGTESITGNSLRFEIELGLDSFNALKSYKYSIEGDKLYVTVKGGMVTGNYHSRIEVVIDDDRIEGITEVYAKGGGNTKLLFSIGDTIINHTWNNLD